MSDHRRDFLKRTGAGLAAWSIVGPAIGQAAEGKPVASAARSQPAAAAADLAVALGQTADLKAAHLPPAENDLSRRCLRMLEKWIPVGASYFAAWPGRPNCGHFFGGVHWYGLETVFPAHAFAIASMSPEYDERAARVSRDELRQMAVKAVRYLAFTHDTGPKDCVRPAVGLGRPENCGTKWGERGKGFFKESQCGSVVARLGQICLLLRDHVDEETWMMVARIHADYAQRFGQMPPQNGVYVNTQLEENGWTADGLAACSVFLARHPQARAWEAMARRWMFSTCVVPQDAKDHGQVGAARVAGLTGSTFTALPDYWAENHGMVHPGYTAYAVRSLMLIGNQLRLWGRDLPPELFWNRRRVYENLKPLADGSGYCLAVQGMDWHHLPTAGDTSLHAAAAVFFKDPDAAALERRALRNTELRQEGNGGRMYDKEFAEKAHDQQDPMIMREIAIADTAEVYLLHRLFGPGPEPTPEEQLEQRLRGVRVFAHAGFAHHRRAAGQTALSWRNSVMALPLTREGIYTVAPYGNTWLGTPAVKRRPDSHRLVSVNVATSDDSFAAALVMDRCQESLRQHVLLASLPDGRMLSWESFLALEDLVLESLDQGLLRITNETFPRLGANTRGVRTLYRPDGSKDYRGWLGRVPADDVVDRLGQPAWLNVDDRLGIRFVGPGQTIYHNRHYHRPYRAIADDLVLSRLEGPRPLRGGQATVPLAALLVPEQNHAGTPGAELHVLAGPAHTACLIAEGYLAAANFAPEQQVCLFTRQRPQRIAAYSGATVETKGDQLQVRLILPGRSPRLLEATSTLRVEGDVRIDAAADGRTYVVNCGRQPSRVEVLRPQKPSQPQVLRPGEVKAF